MGPVNPLAHWLMVIDASFRHKPVPPCVPRMPIPGAPGHRPESSTEGTLPYLGLVTYRSPMHPAWFYLNSLVPAKQCG